MTEKNKRIIIFTDGACKGNPGPGGYGILMKLEDSAYKKSFYEGYRRTTNNRMELMAVVEALKKIKRPGEEVFVVTDSKYISDALNKGWLEKWKERGFKKIKNPDLWKALAEELDKHTVHFEWVKGHNKHPENEYCDRLARKAAAQPIHKLKRDDYYEKHHPEEKQ